MRGLAKQKPVLVDSLAPVTTSVIKGEAAVGITYVKYVKQYKGPVHYVLMDKYLADPNYMSVGVKAANPNAAKLYVDYACSPEGQKHIAEDGEFVFAPGRAAADQGCGKGSAEYHSHGQSVGRRIQEVDERDVPRNLLRQVILPEGESSRRSRGPAFGPAFVVL